MSVLRRRSVYKDWRINQGFGQPFTLNKDSPQARGLAGWWPMLPGGGRVLRDLSGFGNTGTSNSFPTWIRDANRGVTLDFDGIDDFIDAGTGISLNVTKNFTISTWIKADDPSPATVIISKVTDGNDKQYNLTVISGRLRLEYEKSGNNYFLDTATDLISTDWIHVALTISESLTAKMYLNAVERASDTGLTEVTAVASNPVNIGKRGGVDNDRFFAGAIDDMRIYNRALTAAEIYQILSPSTRWDLYRSLDSLLFSISRRIFITRMG